VEGKREEVAVYELLSGTPPNVLEPRLRTRSILESGVSHLVAGDLPRAIDALSEVVRLDPQDTAAKALLADAKR
jgi:hypothetical protein